MKKKIFIGIGAVLAVFVLWSVYGLFFAPKKSPTTSASINDKGLEIKVSYSQPSKRGRLIFGEESQKALQPYGKYWRLGANAATEITFSKDITFAGQPVNAGSYRMYAVPGASSFKIILNSELGVNFTAASEPDHSLDILTTEIPVNPLDTEVETFTISFQPDSVGVNMNLAWDKVGLRVPIGIR
ncbi:MAG TPA: DUF2911 domain-containing protein [Cyclobacteriaceae bacterium]|nr:DUF2911 domain-containing protein [Cyclobacteriaceae bacterium]